MSCILQAKDIQAEESRTLGSASSTPRTRSPSSRPLTPIGAPEPSLVSTPVVTKKPVLNVTQATNPQTRIQIVEETDDAPKAEKFLCPFNTFGCTRSGSEPSIKQHLCDEKEVHIAKLREAISPLKTGILGVVDGFELPTRRLTALENYMQTVNHLYG
ncbi:hypothetical protein AAVH_04780 [Aphelenchoides avenae]|nr:hypothetical protein AAVH_04780 [Aphelenchus avenae]